MIDKIMIFFSKIIKKYTNFMIWWYSNLEKTIKNNKKLLIVFWHPKCKPCQKIMFKIPIIYFKTNKKNITLRFCNVLENCEECKKNWITLTPILRYYENWNLIDNITDEKEIFTYLKTL